MSKEKSAGHGEQIRRAVEAINGFYDTVNRIAGAIKEKVDALVQQAKSPMAHEPEDLSAELSELDTAIERLGGAGVALQSIAETADTGADTAPGVTPIGDAPNPKIVGSGPEGGSTAAPGNAPAAPNMAAPGAAVTPTGSADLGPGGGGPVKPVGGFRTTLSGARLGSQELLGESAEDAPVAQPGQAGVPPATLYPAGRQSGVGKAGDSVAAPVTGGPTPEGEAGGE